MSVSAKPHSVKVAQQVGGVATTVRGLLWTGVLVLVALTTFSLLARSWWVFDLFTHLRVHYVAFGVVLVILALVARRYFCAVVAAACCTVHVIWLLPLLLVPSPAFPDSAGRVIRVATINILVNNQTPERVIAVLDQYQPDVVALQETTPWWPEPPAALLAAYPYRAPLAWNLGRSVTLISKFPILSHQMWSGGGLRLQIPELTINIDGQPITVIGVHPPHPLRPRYNRARRVYLANMAHAANQARYPVIMLGDFNTTPYSPLFQDLIDDTGLRNAGDGFGYRPTWVAAMGLLGIPIDLVLVSPQFVVESVEVGPDIGSDHAPLIVDLRLMPGPSE